MQGSPDRICTQDGCNRLVKARDLCSTHYNQTCANQHRKQARVCDACGTAVLKEARTPRYENVYCSELCRQWHRFGPRSTPLPKAHWALHFGETCEWTPRKPKTKPSRTCEWCGARFESWQPTAKYCSHACVVRRHRKIRRAREHNAPGYFTWAQLTRLWNLFDRQCAYCGESIALIDTQAEHVHPLSKGGRNDIGNILPSCGACNRDKRDILLPDWNADRQRRGLDARVTAWDDHDPRYAHMVKHAPLKAA